MCITNRGHRRAVALSLFYASNGTVGVGGGYPSTAGAAGARTYYRHPRDLVVDLRDRQRYVKRSTESTVASSGTNSTGSTIAPSDGRVSNENVLTSSFLPSSAPVQRQHQDLVEVKDESSFVPAPQEERREQNQQGNHHEAQQQLVAVADPSPQKTKAKRHRQPQKPGLTAKKNQRHFVQHNYHDHANDVDSDAPESADPLPSDGASVGAPPKSRKGRGGVTETFPRKLHSLLDQIESDGLAYVISWAPHGRAFLIRRPKEFVDEVMPKYFRQTKLTSFQRQLNLYGFQRITRGPDAGAYYHELFLRGKPFLTKDMVRIRVKGTRFKAASSPDQEPNFYRMPPVGTHLLGEVVVTEDDASKLASASSSVGSSDGVTEGRQRSAASLPSEESPQPLPAVVAFPSSEPACEGRGGGTDVTAQNKWMPPPPLVLGSPGAHLTAEAEKPLYAPPSAPFACRSIPAPAQSEESTSSHGKYSKLWDYLDPYASTPEAPNLPNPADGSAGAPTGAAPSAGPWPVDAPAAGRIPATAELTRRRAGSAETSSAKDGIGVAPAPSYPQVADRADERPTRPTEKRRRVNGEDEMLDCIMEDMYEPAEACPPPSCGQQPLVHVATAAAAASDDGAGEPQQDEPADLLLSFAREWAPATVVPPKVTASAPAADAASSDRGDIQDIADFERVARNIRDDDDLGRLLERLVEA